MGESSEEKISFASVVNIASPVVPGEFDYYSYPTLDKLPEIPEKWKDKVAMARFFFETEPIAGTTIEKMVEIGISGFYNAQGEISDKEFEVFEAVKNIIFKFLNDAALEYLISGLVIPEVTWEAQPLRYFNPNYKGWKRYTLPVDIWLRDPAVIEIVQTPIPSRLLYFVNVPHEFVEFIQNKGVYPDGTEDKATYQLLVKDYPEFVRKVQRGETRIQLEDPFVIRRKTRTSSP